MSSAGASNAAVQAGAQRAATGSPLDALFQQFGQLEAQTLLQEFLSALSAGVNPRQIAKELSDTIDQLSYGRAETIMRTESLGAWNDAALENYRANSDIIGSWMWVCMPGAGTCVSCLEEDGTIYGLDEELDDHPNGRCCKGPVTNDYGDILGQYGIDASGEDFGPGPWDDRQTGEEWLLAQDAATQRASFGSNAAYNAWRAGDAKLADFVAVRHDAVWGDSIYQQSLRGMGLDARDYAVGKVAYAAEMPEIPAIESPEVQQLRASLDALDPNAIHPTAADKFGLDLRNTYRVEVDGQPYFVKAEHAPMEMNGVRYDVEAQTMAADKVAQLMGMGDSVVPARFIENDAGRFIVQPWVGGTELSKLDETALKEAFANMPAADIQRQSLFGYLVGDSDRNAAGYFLMPDGSIKAVDFGGAFDVSSPGLVNNFMQIAVPGKDVANVAIDRTVAEDLLSHVAETKVALQQYGLDDAQLTLFDEQAAKLQAVLAQQENPAFYDLLSDHTYYTAPDRDALLTVGRPTEEVTTAIPESPAIQQLRADREALQAQHDAIQAKQDLLSARWAKIVRETDFTEEDEAAAAEKKLAAIEKQQAGNITKMDKLDAKMAKLDAKLPEVPRIEPLAREAEATVEKVSPEASEVGRQELYDAIKTAPWTSMADYERDVITPLVDQLQNNPAWQRLLEKASSGQIKDLAWRTDLYKTNEDAAKELITRWTMGSELPESVAMKMAAIEEFGLPNDLASVTKDAELLAQVQADYGDVMGGLRAFDRAAYDQTQAWFAEHNITSVRLYRGLSSPEPIGADARAVVASLRPITSTSADFELAAEFASQYGDLGRVYAFDVPADHIMSIPLTGMGESSKSEVLMLGGQYDGAMVGGLRLNTDAKNVLQTWYERTAAAQTSLAEALDAVAKETTTAAREVQAAELPPEAAATQSIIHGAPLTYTLPEIDQKAEAALIQQLQDAIPDAGVASHTDAIDIGNTIDSYVQERIGPLQDYVDELNAIRAHPQDLTGDQIAWLHGDLSQHGGLTTNEVMQQYQAARRDETVRLLSQVRDVGGTDLELAGGAPAALEDAIRQAQEVFPTAWLDASNSDGAVKLVQEATRRGYYRADINGGDGTLALRANAGSTPDDLYTAAVHELGHRMEASVDGVWQMEQQFYDARTAGEPWKALDPSLRVVGRTKVDQWAQEYLGLDPKTIVRAGGLAPIQHYELLSSGLEWLLGADSSGAYWLSRDPEYRQFIYGILFGTRGAGGG